MRTQDGGHRDDAVAALADRRYDAAGDAYARAGWRTLADPRPDQAPFDPDERGWVGIGVQYLVTSAICHRVAGRSDRATSRGTGAAAVAADLRTALEHPAQRACLQELIGDSRLAGGLDGGTEAYREAAEAYCEAAASIDDPQHWSTTPLFEAAAAPLQQAARGRADGEIAITWDDLHGSDPGEPGAFLAHRTTVKRQHFGAIVEGVVEDGHLAAPRGTTEYDNATYQCPNCGSSDVNWVGERALCLRCSTPTER